MKKIIGYSLIVFFMICFLPIAIVYLLTFGFITELIRMNRNIFNKAVETSGLLL